MMGEIVIFTLPKPYYDEQEYPYRPAIVTRVHSDGRLNLAVTYDPGDEFKIDYRWLKNVAQSPDMILPGHWHQKHRNYI